MMEPCNVLVTGGCGFIGSNFINHLALAWPQSTIVNLDKLRTGASADNVEAWVRDSGRYHLVVADYGNERLVEKVLEEQQIELVVHFAAWTHVDESYEYPMETFQNNVINLLPFLNACSAYAKLRKFVHISTDEVYGDSEMGPEAEAKRESDHLNPTNPYSASKAACEQVVHTFRHSNGLPALILRMNNVYGPRQFHSKVIPKFIKKVMAGEPLTIQVGNAEVSDCVLVGSEGGVARQKLQDSTVQHTVHQ